MPEPYDANLLLGMLGIEFDWDEWPRTARLTVTHPLIAGTGYLWAPVVIAMADAVCAFSVNAHWPEGARTFTTVECKANFFSSAKEGERVVAIAEALHTGRTTHVWDATIRNESTERLMASYRCTQLFLY